MSKIEKTLIKTESGIRRFAITLNLPRKKIFFSTPSFLVEPKSSKDIQFLCSWYNTPQTQSGCFQGMVIPLNKVRTLLNPYKSRSAQLTLTGDSKEESYLNIVNDKLLIIDPQTEASLLP